jgi:hypothetical protein
MIHLLRQKATRQQIDEMLQELGTFIKLAVDIERDVLAGGGVMHADCEMVLLNDGSQQKDVWGADWVHATQSVEFDAIINIRPNQQNFSMTIQDLNLRQKVESITRKLLEGV